MFPVGGFVEEDKKPGTTRLAFIFGGISLCLMAFVVGIYILYAENSDRKELAMLFAGAIATALGAISTRYFGGKQ